MRANAWQPLVAAWLSAALIGWAWCHDGACLQGGKHRAEPSPEPFLRECTLYSDNACCSEQDTQELAGSPISQVDGVSWDRCGPLSPVCEGFLKRLACFYRCSPDAARWAHPHRPSAIQGVPLCLSFCQDWFEACKEDLICAHNWVSDWEWGPQGNNCTRNCIPFQQMYTDSKDLCDSLWGDSFVAVDDAGQGDQSSCACLSLGPSDRQMTEALRAQEGNPDELDTTKTGLPPAPCRRLPTLPPQARRSNNHRNALRKRSLFVEDVEGSGSGF
ncbi:retbindin [Lepisosteus oculatus]|uniref:retbindin n=1 Tax=Lepisosteus oculatus TaxID=7918 RepID=UPI0035F5264B